MDGYYDTGNRPEHNWMIVASVDDEGQYERIILCMGCFLAVPDDGTRLPAGICPGRALELAETCA